MLIYVKNVDNYEYQKIIMCYRNIKDTERGKNKKKGAKKKSISKNIQKRQKKEYAKEYKKIDTKILCLKR